MSNFTVAQVFQMLGELHAENWALRSDNTVLKQALMEAQKKALEGSPDKSGLPVEQITAEEAAALSKKFGIPIEPADGLDGVREPQADDNAKKRQAKG